MSDTKNKPKAKKHYVNNKKLYEVYKEFIYACREAKELGKEQPKTPNYIGEAIFLIAYRLATKPKFSGYSYKDEMISDGIENAVQYLTNFNPDKYDNPFAYLTKIIYFAFIRRIHKEKKQQYIKHKKITNDYIFENLVSRQLGDKSIDPSYVDPQDQYANDFVSTYELKLAEKKERARVRIDNKEKDFKDD